ncbi:steroid 17-alpha-hydroxylase/17,20 lyase-like [Ostrea edulis]|uniref:steroid 17-alpha-hydroxylase/17,20 lyase-like n=1 Tax=Ostrea edulis TaxID=37623 RepID=UPI0020941EF8|nr:steroid 17-alpha-hydroxylase/17,20 lyase-like [Ostrea edulis]XP_056004399.1 steroid 17-alpha-hydroxylase/17,20 lyase-like [Ostrea edulis]XP_056004400.1 steroid 17-alpha-hydroxylase/17,20 lyase-like [Ostrea edulis]XP_056004401.1 steroid 17-alpha-hydroxylase/17,20 lyase-like [Ostrea edulis]XP_056004402.1 steroid 17-alpha-hydroxylase/17,20 lyase-like [Ostrea edulis]
MIDVSVNIQTVLAGVSIGLVVLYVIKRMRYRLPPGPWCLPLVGNYSVYSSFEIHRKMRELSKKYGPVISLSVGTQTWIILNNIDVVLEAMVKKKADFAGRPKFASGDLFSEGGKDIALSTYSPTWKFHRKIAGKALRHYLQGDLLEHMIQDNMNKFLDKMAQEKDPFCAKDYINLMIFHQLYTICFGEKRAVDDPEVKAYLQLDEELNDGLGTGVLEDVFPYFKDIYPTAKWKKLKSNVNESLTLLRTKFKQHVDTLEPGINRDFTDSLLIARQEAENEGDEAALEKLDDAHLIQTISDIFFAGVDTTRMTMDWFVYFMTKHPEIQSKCQEEIDRVVGSGIPSMKNRNNFDFLEACLFETMRLANVTGLGVPHMTICDSQVGGYDIPKGTTVMINHWALHHDPKYWKDHESFDPNRYLDENGKLKPAKPESWLPFSAGRRVCLGETVAKPEMLLMCANLLKRFEIRLPDGIKANPEYRMMGFGVELPSEYKIVVTERE